MFLFAIACLMRCVYLKSLTNPLLRLTSRGSRLFDIMFRVRRCVFLIYFIHGFPSGIRHYSDDFAFVAYFVEPAGNMHGVDYAKI